MKKKSLLPLLALLLSLPLSGCRLEHYSRHDVIEYLKEEFPKERFGVSRDYEEALDGNGYTDRWWDMRFRDDPDAIFHVFSDEYYGMESIDHTLRTDYEQIFGKKIFEKYAAAHATELELIDRDGYYHVESFFRTRRTV